MGYFLAGLTSEFDIAHDEIKYLFTHLILTVLTRRHRRRPAMHLSGGVTPKTSFRGFDWPRWSFVFKNQSTLTLALVARKVASKELNKCDKVKQAWLVGAEVRVGVFLERIFSARALLEI